MTKTIDMAIIERLELYRACKFEVEHCPEDCGMNLVEMWRAANTFDDAGYSFWREACVDDYGHYNGYDYVVELYTWEYPHRVAQRFVYTSIETARSMVKAAYETGKYIKVKGKHINHKIASSEIFEMYDHNIHVVNNCR